MMGTDTLKRLEQIAEQYEFKDVLDLIAHVKQRDKVVLGLLGLYTAPCAAIANSLFGTSFPEEKGDDGIKVLCRIEGDPSIEHGCMYFHETPSGQQQLSGDDMRRLATEVGTDGQIVARVPELGLLKRCVCIVYPGMNVSDEEDARILGSLALTDFFCYVFSVNMREEDISAISCPLISCEPDCVSFLYAQMNVEASGRDNAIFADAVNNVSTLPAFENICVEQNFHRCCVSNAVSMGECTGVLAKRLDDMSPELSCLRQEKSIEKILDLLSNDVERRLVTLGLPPEDISGKKQEYYETIQRTQDEQRSICKRFDLVGERIGLRLKNEFTSLKWGFMGAASQQERASIIGKFLNETVGIIVEEEYKNEFDNIDAAQLDRCVDRTDIMRALNEINQSAKRATQVADFFNVVGTAALMTLGPMEGGGNLLEGIAGAILGSQTEEHAFGNLRKFNPVVMATDFASDIYRESVFDEYIDKMKSMGRGIASSTYDFLNRFYLEPKRLEAEHATAEIMKLENQRCRGLLDVANEKRDLEAIRRELAMLK